MQRKRKCTVAWSFPSSDGLRGRGRHGLYDITSRAGRATLLIYRFGRHSTKLTRRATFSSVAAAMRAACAHDRR